MLVARHGDPQLHPTPLFVMDAVNDAHIALDSTLRQLWRYDDALGLALHRITLDATAFADYDALVASQQREIDLAHAATATVAKQAWRRGFRIGAVVTALPVVTAVLAALLAAATH